MQRVFSIFSRLFERLSGKRILYFTPSKHNALGRTASWSDLGFWYVGNVYDPADIAYGIAQNGMVEQIDTSLVIKILGELTEKYSGLTVYDIGANTGYYGILAAVKFNATVHSFEPLSEHTSCIRESARINGQADKVTVHDIALGHENGNLDISIAGSGSTLIKDFLGQTDAPLRKVVVKTIDSLNLPTPHFIKIDVEGYELPVLRGSYETIRRHRPICLVEIAKTFQERNFLNPQFDDVIRFFRELNYKIERSTPAGLIDLKDIPDGVAMYLCTPQQVSGNKTPQYG